MSEKASVQELFDFIKSNLTTFMSEESVVGVNDFVFKRVVGDKDILLRLKKDSNSIGLKVQEGDLNGLLVSTLSSSCCLPFGIAAGQKVLPSVTFMEDRELLLVQMFKPMAPERYSVEVDLRTPRLLVQHSSHLSPVAACFHCASLPLMTCGE